MAGQIGGIGTTGLAALAVGAVALIGGGVWYAGRVPAVVTEPAAVATVEPSAKPEPEAKAEVQPEAKAEVAPPVATPAPAFDVVRVEPDGSAVIAGSAAPGARVVFLMDGTEVGEAKADAQGKFAAVLALDLGTAQHVLSMMSETGGDKVASEEQIILAPVAEPDVKVAEAETTAPAADPVASAEESGTVTEAAAKPEVSTETVADGTAAKPDGTAVADGTAAKPEGTVVADTVPAKPEGTVVADAAAPATPQVADAPAPGVAEPKAEAVATAEPVATAEGTATRVAEAAEAGTSGQGASQVAEADAAKVADASDGAAAQVSGTAEAGVAKVAEAAESGAVKAAGTAGSDDAGTAAPSEVKPVAESATVTAEPAKPAEKVEAAEAPATDAAKPVETVAEARPRVPVPTLSDQASAPQAPAAGGEASGLGTRTAAPVQTPVATSVAVLKATKDGVEVIQPATPERPEAMEQIALDTISYSEAGEVQLAGRAGGQATVRVYLDNKAVADIGADAGGQWKGELSGIKPGIYTLRLDALNAGGEVVSRLETPFKRESPEVLNPPAQENMPDQAPVIRAVTVQKGDTLWAISRERYGDGVLYVRVFDANRDSIRDPDLIYPGQVFSIP
ncbi:LysM peptidoglycan-binding domain-containing protein [Seohaeicola nanhaiensis]|uniref:LysM peptidoglycan-binding domain-containing protein n=1 Tax=Seohaeicola nanhaiensis TaxID=1387282 RepID=A0ABV9KL05_9RHOB